MSPLARKWCRKEVHFLLLFYVIRIYISVAKKGRNFVVKNNQKKLVYTTKCGINYKGML